MLLYYNRSATMTAQMTKGAVGTPNQWPVN